MNNGMRMGIKEKVSRTNSKRKTVKKLKEVCKNRDGKWKTINSRGTASCEFECGSRVEDHRDRGILEIQDGEVKEAAKEEEVDIREDIIHMNGRKIP